MELPSFRWERMDSLGYFVIWFRYLACLFPCTSARECSYQPCMCWPRGSAGLLRSRWNLARVRDFYVLSWIKCTLCSLCYRVCWSYSKVGCARLQLNWRLTVPRVWLYFTAEMVAGFCSHSGHILPGKQKTLLGSEGDRDPAARLWKLTLQAK